MTIVAPGAMRATRAEVRAFRARDIPAVVALRAQVFRRTEHRHPRQLSRYIEELFFEPPFGPDAADASLVAEDRDGRLVGFLGVLPRTMRWGGVPLSVAVATQLMAAPGAGALVGLQLSRKIFESAFDLVLSDTANDAARVLWQRAGGTAVASSNVTWERRLRRFRVVPVRGRRESAPVAGDRSSDLDLRRDGPAIEAILSTWRLRPAFDPSALDWIIARAERKRGTRAVIRRRVVNGDGRFIGWYVTAVSQARAEVVLQVGASPATMSRVLSVLLADADGRRAPGIGGRLDPAISRAVAATGATRHTDGPWTLVRARNPAVAAAIDDGTALISRLDGEWWLGF